MLIEKIHTSADLASFSNEELVMLAEEIRNFLIENVSKTGGHLAANLGVVELTIALHKVFDVNYDRIVWDVGHQSYVHKILTGRADRFSTLRQFGGMSGFPKTEEDWADAFNTGHSSTSISAATGFAAAAKLKGEKQTAVAVIGDGALTGGMAFEALNHAGAMKIPLVVVLNDNGMSISKNVGGLSKKLKKIRNTNRYFEFKYGVKYALKKIPIIGRPIMNGIKKLKKNLKPLIVQNVIFEDLGFTYLGPVDGHDLDELRVILMQAKKLRKPVLVHIQTKKGKGYAPAEVNPDYFHGISSFDFETGQPLVKQTEPDWSAFFGEKLCYMAAFNPKITAITAAMPLGTGLDKFKKQFPDRFYDVGIAEQHAVTFAAGMAKSGLVPCFAVYSSFLQRAYDQLLHDVALQNLHVVFCVDRSGPVGNDGETHQGVFDISYLTTLPNFTVLSPSSCEDFEQMLEYAFNICQGPVAIRYPRGYVKHMEFNSENKYYISGRKITDGKDILICAVGTTVFDAIETAEILGKSGVSAEVVDIGTVKPLDRDKILGYATGKKIVATIEDNVITGGFGEQLSALLGQKIEIFAYPDEPIVQGTVAELKLKYGLSPKQIAERLLKSLK